MRPTTLSRNGVSIDSEELMASPFEIFEGASFEGSSFYSPIFDSPCKRAHPTRAHSTKHWRGSIHHHQLLAQKKNPPTEAGSRLGKSLAANVRAAREMSSLKLRQFVPSPPSLDYGPAGPTFIFCGTDPG